MEKVTHYGFKSSEAAEGNLMPSPTLLLLATKYDEQQRGIIIVIEFIMIYLISGDSYRFWGILHGKLINKDHKNIKANILHFLY